MLECSAPRWEWSSPAAFAVSPGCLGPAVSEKAPFVQSLLGAGRRAQPLLPARAAIRISSCSNLQEDCVSRFGLGNANSMPRRSEHAEALQNVALPQLRIVL